MEYDIHVHLWWEHRIRKVTISSGDNTIQLWFRNFGAVSLEDKKTQNIFAGIMQGLLGKEVEIPEIHVTITKGDKSQSKKVKNTEEFFKALFSAFE
ncbi:MAG: hypothetical protein ACE5KE_05525 [Methanosarcinales archaeon]